MDVFNRLNKLNNENIIWIIYFFIATFAILANYYEKDYVLTKNKYSYGKQKAIHIAIFLVVL